MNRTNRSAKRTATAATGWVEKNQIHLLMANAETGPRLVIYRRDGEFGTHAAIKATEESRTGDAMVYRIAARLCELNITAPLRIERDWAGNLTCWIESDAIPEQLAQLTRAARHEGFDEV